MQNEQIFPPDLTIKIEIIKNRIYIMDPSPIHQEILGMIYTYINMFVIQNKLGKVYPAPISVKIDENTVLKPDIVYLSVRKSSFLTNKGIEGGSPDIVVEVISKANYKKLRNLKKQIYGLSSFFGGREKGDGAIVCFRRF
ncbi:MAG: Uma2 family endonuclease [Cytophagales bacterium]|nr:MAG: Uma2 family endonuclease [Cytophagales bacterium]